MKPKRKTIAPCNYAAWDKYDVDTELNKIDLQDEQQKVEAKRLLQEQKKIIQEKKLQKNAIINKGMFTKLLILYKIIL